MEVITLVTLMALVVKITSVVKAIGKDNNAVVTQLVTWAVGVAVLFLAAQATITSGIVVFDGIPALGDLDNASLVLVGLSYASGGSFAYDLKKAIDSSDSAAEPSLLKKRAG